MHEKVNEKVAQNIRKETADEVKKTGEAIVKKLVDRGFRKEDVSGPVRSGILDGYDKMD